MAFSEEIDLDTKGKGEISTANRPITDLHLQGPNNEPFGAFTFPLPLNYLICRTLDDTSGQFQQNNHGPFPFQSVGRCWMDALALAMTCSKLLHREDSISSFQDDSSQSATSFSSTVSNTFYAEKHSGSFRRWFIDGTDGPCLEEDRMSDLSVDISKISKSGTSISESSQDLLTRMHGDEDVEDQTPYVAAPEEEMAEVRKNIDRRHSDAVASF